jgi:putative hemin transport protein
LNPIEFDQHDPHALRQAWDDLKKTDKPPRAREAAQFLGVSECTLVASKIGVDTVRLVGGGAEPWLAILKRVTALGKVMALTRNDTTVHERRGVYGNLSASGSMGLALGDDIDLRLFFSHWAHGYAICESTDSGAKRSLQFFNAAGEAVHKIFLTDHSSIDEFELLTEQFRAEDQTPGQRVMPPAVAEPALPDAHIDVKGFRAGWAALTDTHEFFGLLKTFNLKRTQALRLADPRFALAVEPSSARHMLMAAAASGLSIMCFVGSSGCIQIHTGPVVNIKVMGPWLNVLDPDFNLHLREDRIEEAWVVRKPTTEGIVTSLELFDASGNQMAQFFGKRKPGIPELDAWRQIIAELPSHSAARQVA